MLGMFLKVFGGHVLGISIIIQNEDGQSDLILVNFIMHWKMPTIKSYICQYHGLDINGALTFQTGILFLYPRGRSDTN